MKKITCLLLLISCLSCAQKEQKKKEEKEDVLRFSMHTPWTDSVSKTIPWNVYPRPQMKRDNWQNLNGEWEYAILPVSVQQPDEYQGAIVVPFAIESELSGVKKLVGEDNNLWYKRSFEVQAHSASEKIHLNFGAVDWQATVYINGEEVGTHKGGFTPFSFDITSFLIDGTQELTIKVWDPSDAETQPRGKQVANPSGIWYTPVTGIWQTVWLEKTSEEYIDLLKITPDVVNAQVTSEIVLGKISGNRNIKVTAMDEDKTVASRTFEVKEGDERLMATLEVPSPVLWSPENPHLYDLKVEIMDGDKVLDEVGSYFGMRKISLGKDENGFTRIMLNDEALFQFGLLDQGWFPDGLYTAPTFEAMIYDVEMTKKWGFNMIRKHVKVEPATYYYECDKMGMLVWQDMPNGNYLEELRIQAWDEKDSPRTKESSRQFEWELKEMMDNLHTFASILVWVPFNEGWGQYDTERVTQWTKEYDSSRLIDSPSGWADRGVGDMVDVHLYPGPGMEFPEEDRAAVLGEFAGIGWPVKDHMWWDKKNWGYLTYDNQATFKQKFTEIIKDLQSLKSFGLSAAVYTQTTDVEGEVNGLMTYDRKILKLEPSETHPMLAPLYEDVQKYKTIIADSEHSPNQWKLSKIADDSWRNSNGISEWQTVDAPVSSYDNYFLPEGTLWENNEELFLAKEFEINSVPEELILRFYLDKASMKVYINGNEVTEEKFEGGRKRHYRNKVITNAGQLVHVGKNVITIELQADKKDHSFDMGIYTVDNHKIVQQSN